MPLLPNGEQPKAKTATTSPIAGNPKRFNIRLSNTDLLTSKRNFLKKKDPAKSTLYSTLSATQDDLRMPPVVLNPDPLALGLVKAWIESLP